MSKAIPKIIHQTYKTTELPSHWEESRNKWKELHPDYEYKFWTDKDLHDLISINYKWFLPIYEAYPYNIQRVDAARYFILYHYGGIYSDLDFVPMLSFDQLLSNNNDLSLRVNGSDKDIVLFCKSPNMKTITNAIMASSKGASFWQNVFDELSYRFHNQKMYWIGKGLTVFNTTGPSTLDHVVRKVQKQYTEKERKGEPGKCSISFMPENVIPCGVCEPKPYWKNGYYLKVTEGGSWGDSLSRCMVSIYCNWFPFLLIILLIILFIIIKQYI